MPTASGIFTTGRNADIDTTAETLKPNEVALVFGILVKAHKDNAGIVYVGPKGVTADTEPATDGYPLYAGDAVFIEIDNLIKVYVIASEANQQASFIAS